jgi:hypothetical protein
LCEFLTAAGAGQPGHLRRADRQSARLHGPFPLFLKPFFFFFKSPSPRSLSSPSPSLAPLRAARANYTQPPTSV